MSEQPTPAALALLERLDRAGLPVPAPVADLNGRTVRRIDGHPALLAPRLPGNHPEAPSEAQCRAIGQFLARMHRASSELDGPAHPRDTVWLEAGLAAFARRLDFISRGQLDTAVSAIAAAERRRDFARLPTGLVHEDLFRDNAMFEGDRLTGVIDFHHAARATRLRSRGGRDGLVYPWGRTARPGTRACSKPTQPSGRSRRRTLVRPLLLVQACVRFLVARLHSPRKSPAR